MTDPKSPESPESSDSNETESFTAWHPMLVALLEFYLPTGWKLTPELLLSRLPQRVDIVVLRLTEQVAGEVRKLRSVFDYLRPHTLIEHKGPTDDLEPWDVLTLLAYAGQYMRLCKVSDPDQLCLMVLCDHIPGSFVEQVERMGGSFAPVGNGLWRGRIAGLLLHGIEARDAHQASPSEHLLYTFSRAYLTQPRLLLPLDLEEERVYVLLYQQVEQFRRKRGTMALRDLEAAQKTHEEVMAEAVKLLSPEVRVQGLAPEQIANVLTPEQRLAGLTPEQILAALPPEFLPPKVRVQGLAPEQIANVLTPEQRLAGLTPEQILAALPPEAREQLARKLRQ